MVRLGGRTIGQFGHLSDSTDHDRFRIDRFPSERNQISIFVLLQSSCIVMPAIITYNTVASNLQNGQLPSMIKIEKILSHTRET